jgi:magnesium chelatase family protein
VQESVSRIQAALRNSGYRWPGPKVTINLAPAEVKKDSAAVDLPIAIACMISGGRQSRRPLHPVGLTYAGHGGMLPV